MVPYSTVHQVLDICSFGFDYMIDSVFNLCQLLLAVFCKRSLGQVYFYKVIILPPSKGRVYLEIRTIFHVPLFVHLFVKALTHSPSLSPLLWPSRTNGFDLLQDLILSKTHTHTHTHTHFPSCLVRVRKSDQIDNI